MPQQTVSKIYANACSIRLPEYYDYEDMRPEWGDQDNYEIIRKIGRGRYSDVFDAYSTNNDEFVVIKVLKPVKKRRIKRELKILQNLAGGTNIVCLKDIVRDPISKVPALVFERVNADDFRKLYPSLSDYYIRYYMCHLLHALDYCHSHGTMHRDVKPHNIMIDHSTNTLRLIDFGLAEFYHPAMNYNVRVASRFYKAPELLVDLQCYDYAVDMWSFGCVLAGIVTGREPFFRGSSNEDQLYRIVAHLGSREFFEFLATFGLDLVPALRSQFASLPAERTKIESMVQVAPDNITLKDGTIPRDSDGSRGPVPQAAIDLIDRCLVYDHRLRLTAKEAIAHEYFDPVRERVTAEVRIQQVQNVMLLSRPEVQPRPDATLPQDDSVLDTIIKSGNTTETPVDVKRARGEEKQVVSEDVIQQPEDQEEDKEDVHNQAEN